MKERPILFSGPMVSAILAGRKTQTRRIIKGARRHFCALNGLGNPVFTDDEITYQEIRMRFETGMRLWVRETWKGLPDYDDGFSYRADWSAEDERKYPRILPWKSPIHMPRRASRITLEVTDVRVERLQDISEVDAYKEGCGTDDCRRCNTEGLEQSGPHKGLGCEDCSGEGQISSRANYRKLWESIHGPGSWDLNPWVFAVSFRRIEGRPHD